MSDHLRWFLGLAAILLLLAAGHPQPVSADGMVITIEVEAVKMPTQKAILVYDEKSGHEDLILSVEVQGGSEAAWVVPVPSLPEVKAASSMWFEQLSHLSQPRIEYRVRSIPCVETVVTVEVGKEIVVELLSREQVGIYDVSILSADEPGALLDWLNKNGYAFPDEGGPLLDTYIEEGGWYFVAARVLPGERANLAGDVHPLWFSFDAERPLYPMRLTALMKDYVDVLIYVLADHRMVIPGQPFGTDFAAELRLQSRGWGEVDTEEVDLLTHRPYYVTKLRGYMGASAMTQDLYFDRAPSDEPYRQVIYKEKVVCIEATQSPSSSERPPASICVGPAMLGLLPVLGLVRPWRSRRKSDEEMQAQDAGGASIVDTQTCA